MTVLQVETDIITSISASLIRRSAILVVMYVEIFKADIIGFIDVFDVTLTYNFHYQRQFVNTGNITQWDKRQNVKINDKWM